LGWGTIVPHVTALSDLLSYYPRIGSGHAIPRRDDQGVERRMGHDFAE